MSAESQLCNVMRVEDNQLMLGLDVSSREAVDWCHYYNKLRGKPFPNGKGHYEGHYVVVKLDVKYKCYLTIQ